MSRLFRNLQVYELAQRIYPRDVVPYLNLEVAYWDTGDYDKALTEGLAASRLDPVSVNVNRVATYIYLDRMDEAESILKQIEQRSQSLTDHRYRLAFLKGDGKDMDRLVVEAAGTRSEDLLLGLHAQHPGVLRTFKESTGDHTTLDGISHASGRQRAQGLPKPPLQSPRLSSGMQLLLVSRPQRRWLSLLEPMYKLGPRWRWPVPVMLHLWTS